MISALRHLGRRFTRRRGPDSVALALSGGAVLGAAHIGVLKALEERQVPVSRLAGTSIGAFVAALYAFGKTPDEIADIVIDLDWLDISRFTLSRFGLLSNSEMGKNITDVLGEVRIEDAPIPLSMIATDLSSGEMVVLEQGDVATAVMASACLPGIFIPVEMGERLLCDGGLVENLPVSPLLKANAGYVIGVDLNARRRYQRPNDIIDLMVNVVDISIDHASRVQAKKVDLLITPELGTFSRTDTSRIAELIDHGYKTAVKALDAAGLKGP
ncbi:patatin-like phospholipase family protein [Desulfuromonas sp. KJ2020]|uniref:patatin-like phospholipase family protein n=1 Tax=Desulfuromonas sp. KJ2020 TaxID=2919173 RepID=UPI000320DF3B|nr:patatin-like phospholipase family protein [Desulfuromonas sp. KJ2020]MCP3177057.1 patatin-like phospholipase family protein [Desulfuromonas sp. KJ2020]